MLIHLEDSSLDIIVAIKVRKRNFDMLMVKHIRVLVHDSDNLCVL